MRKKDNINFNLGKPELIKLEEIMGISAFAISLFWLMNAGISILLGFSACGLCSLIRWFIRG